MKHKKIVVATVFVIALLLIIGFVAYSIILVPENNTADRETTSDNLPHESEENQDDVVYVYKPLESERVQEGGIYSSDEFAGFQVYKVNIASGKMEAVENPFNSFNYINSGEFTGLPADVETSVITTKFIPVIYAANNTHIIVAVNTYDKTQQSDGFDHDYKLLDNQDFICSTDTNVCNKTTILSTAKKLQPDFSWPKAWNTEKTIVMSNPGGHGVGSPGPVIKYNYSDNKISQTTLSNSLTEKEIQRVPAGAFSPLVKKFVIEQVSNEKAQLFLFDTDNLSNAVKIFDVPRVQSDNKKLYSVASNVAWHPEENMVAIGKNEKIFLIDFASGNVRTIYEPQRDVKSFEDGPYVEFSILGKFVVFVEYTGKVSDLHHYGEELPSPNVLKAINVETGEVTEVLTQYALELISNKN